MGMFYVNSKVKLNFGVLKQLDRTAQTALEQTTDALLSEVKNAQVMPFDTGNLNNESTFADYSNLANGVTSIVSDTPYARRLYFHPETVNVRNYVIKKGKRAGKRVNGYIAGKADFSKKYHANAKDHWFEDWQKGGTRENFCVETFAKIYRRLNRL